MLSSNRCLEGAGCIQAFPRGLPSQKWRGLQAHSDPTGSGLPTVLSFWSREVQGRHWRCWQNKE